MADDTNVNVETQKTTTEDGKTQTDAGNGGGDGNGKAADVTSTKKDDETETDYYKRRAEEAEALARRRTGEAENYRKEAQALRKQTPDNQTADKTVPADADPQPKAAEADESKKIRVEVALAGIKDENKRKLVEEELSTMNYGNSLDEVMAAMSKAEDIVDAPYLRRVAQKRGEDHARDVDVAAHADAGAHGRGTKADNALHPEAAATIAEAKRMNKRT